MGTVSTLNLKHDGKVPRLQDLVTPSSFPQPNGEWVIDAENRVKLELASWVVFTAQVNADF